MPWQLSFWSEPFVWEVLCGRRIIGASKQASRWEPLSRLQLSNVTESQTRGASCVVPGAPVLPLSFHSSTVVPPLRGCPPPLRGSLRLLVSSFLLSLPLCSPCSPRLFTFYALDPEDGDSSTYWLPRSFGNSASLIVTDCHNCHNWISKEDGTLRCTLIKKILHEVALVESKVAIELIEGNAIICTTLILSCWMI